MSTLDDCRIVQLAKIADPRGNLTFIEANRPLSFAIRRAFWIYDVPGGESRGGHAYHSEQEFLIALSGSFDVVLDDGRDQKRVHLNRSYLGLYVPNMIWHHMDNFSTNAVCLTLNSQEYSEADYIRNYHSFLQLCGLEMK